MTDQTRWGIDQVQVKKRGNKAKRNIYGLNENNQQFVEDYLTKKIEDNISRYVAKDIIIDMDI
jgi:hypothetical protein